MGLFSFTQPTYKIRDFIWKNRPQKIQALLNSIRERKGKTIVIAHFGDTLTALENELQRANITYSKEVDYPENLIITSAANMLKSTKNLADYQILFAEHHPSLNKEEELLRNITKGLKNAPITFFVAMDEPLMLVFGGERIMQLLEKLGFQEDECIEHSMISSSIQKAQKKIDEKQPFLLDARSSESWLLLNNISSQGV